MVSPFLTQCLLSFKLSHSNHQSLLALLTLLNSLVQPDLCFDPYKVLYMAGVAVVLAAVEAGLDLESLLALHRQLRIH